MSPQRLFCCRCRSESQNYDYFFLVSDTVGYDPFRGVVALDHDVEQLAAAHAPVFRIGYECVPPLVSVIEHAYANRTDAVVYERPNCPSFHRIDKSRWTFEFFSVRDRCMVAAYCPVFGP